MAVRGQYTDAAPTPYDLEKYIVTVQEMDVDTVKQSVIQQLNEIEVILRQIDVQMHVDAAKTFVHAKWLLLRANKFAFRSVCTLGIITTWLYLRLAWRKWRTKMAKQPPEIYGLPIIGSFITLLIHKENFATSILPKYGDIVTYHLGSMQCYKLNDVELISKVFTKAIERAPNV